MLIKLAIVEDEKEYAQLLRGYLKRYEDENSVSFQISVFEDGLDIVEDYKPEYDVILLDIQMKHLDGMKAAEKIRKLDEDVIFIFITSTVQFAVQGYMVDALGYVLKPVPFLAFSQIMKKAVHALGKRQDKTYLPIEVAGGQMRLDSDEIYYVESQRNYVSIHTEKGNFLTYGPLKRIEEQLGARGFIKCHNAYLVNLRHVSGFFHTNLALSNGDEIPVSRAKKKAFLDALTDYIGGIK